MFSGHLGPGDLSQDQCWRKRGTAGLQIIAAVFGFGGIAAAATDIARLLFVVFLALFVIALLMGRRGTAPPL